MGCAGAWQKALEFNTPEKPYSRIEVQSFRENLARETDLATARCRRRPEVTCPESQISRLLGTGP
jgi:hypothetical protein